MNAILITEKLQPHLKFAHITSVIICVRLSLYVCERDRRERERRERLFLELLENCVIYELSMQLTREVRIIFSLASANKFHEYAK